MTEPTKYFKINEGLKVHRVSELFSLELCIFLKKSLK